MHTCNPSNWKAAAGGSSSQTMSLEMPIYTNSYITNTIAVRCSKTRWVSMFYAGFGSTLSPSEFLVLIKTQPWHPQRYTGAKSA